LALLGAPFGLPLDRGVSGSGGRVQVQGLRRW
jgi:hypothetical protein